MNIIKFFSYILLTSNFAVGISLHADAYIQNNSVGDLTFWLKSEPAVTYTLPYNPNLDASVAKFSLWQATTTEQQIVIQYQIKPTTGIYSVPGEITDIQPGFTTFYETNNWPINITDMANNPWCCITDKMAVSMAGGKKVGSPLRNITKGNYLNYSNGNLALFPQATQYYLTNDSNKIFHIITENSRNAIIVQQLQEQEQAILKKQVITITFVAPSDKKQIAFKKFMLNIGNDSPINIDAAAGSRTFNFTNQTSFTLSGQMANPPKGANGVIPLAAQTLSAGIPAAVTVFLGKSDMGGS